MDIGFETSGISALIKKLDYLGENAEPIVMAGLRKGAMKVQADAKRAAPADTGRLRQSIVVNEIQGGYTVGTNVEYAPYVEYGTGTLGDPSVPHTTKTEWRYQDHNGNWHTTHGHAAQPFLHPALMANESYVQKVVRLELAKALKTHFAD